MSQATTPPTIATTNSEAAPHWPAVRSARFGILAIVSYSIAASAIVWVAVAVAVATTQ